MHRDKKVMCFYRAEQRKTLETKTIEKGPFDEVFWSIFTVPYDNTHL